MKLKTLLLTALTPAVTLLPASGPASDPWPPAATLSGPELVGLLLIALLALGLGGRDAMDEA